MRRLIVPCLLASALGVVFTERSQAQIFNNPSRTYGVGSSTGSGPRFSGFGAGILPFNYRGSPGAAEGKMTAPDHRMTNTAPGFGTGLGWFGKRSPSPRPEPNFQFNPPVIQQNTAEPPLDDAPEAAPTPAPAPQVEPIGKESIIVEVRVPFENAEVFVNKQPTKQTGMVRTFGSPPLPRGERYQYEVRVQWQTNGKSMSGTQILIGKPGERLVADFAK